jgi:hypothetical protein
MMGSRTIFNSKNVFLISILVVTITILGVWLFGVGTNNTVFKNSLESITIISVAFFLFITIGLYKGAKLKDNLGKITDKFDSKKIRDQISSIDFGIDGGFENIDLDIDEDGIIGIIATILLWIAASVLILFAIWIFGNLFWMSILIFMAMLYWLFFRALRLIFKNSKRCKGKISISVFYGFGYTILYNFWIYGILIAIRILSKQ